MTHVTETSDGIVPTRSPADEATSQADAKPVTATLEKALAATESMAAAAERAAADLHRTARELQKAAHSGDLGRLHRGCDHLGESAAAATASASEAMASWTLSPEAEEQHLRTGYEAELLAAAGAAGLHMVSQDERLIAFPSVLRIVPGQRCVEVDRKKVTALRPSYLVNLLRKSQSKKPRFTPERFLETLHAAYRLVVAGEPEGTGVTLDKVYAALTLMPDVRRDYTQTDFGRDIFFLDRSQVQRTRTGARLSFPASSGTRGSRRTFQFVSPEGERVSYYGVRFIEEAG